MPVEKLKKALFDIKKDMNASEIEHLISILKGTSKYYQTDISEDLIHKNAYNHVIKAQSSFDACDFDGSNSITLSELRYMLYCFEGSKPDDWKL